MKVEDVRVTGCELESSEIENYIIYIEEKNKSSVTDLWINVDGQFVDLKYTLAPQPFERIRRITGYLVGTMDHWNDAKSAEEHDRVKHMDMNNI